MPENTLIAQRYFLQEGDTCQQFATFIDDIRENYQSDQDSLIALLKENHPVFVGKSGSNVMRMKSYAMASFYNIGAPDDCIEHIIDVLDNSDHAYAIASAARAIRGLKRPHPDLAIFLVNAIPRIWSMNKPICFESFDVKWPLKNYATALDEIFLSLSFMGKYALTHLNKLEHIKDSYEAQFTPEVFSHLCSCIDDIKNDKRQIKTCCIPPLNLNAKRNTPSNHKKLRHLKLQDQDANTYSWEEYFSRKVSLIAFFYVTCTNPKKCSQTIYNLSAVQNYLEESGLSNDVQIAAITYTSALDSQDTLKKYGISRGLVFGENCKMFRCVDCSDDLIKALNLQVNFIGSTVNQHSIELFLFDESCSLVKTFPRVQVEPSYIAHSISQQLTKTRSDITSN